ncbi:hypothetical protein TSMEX_008708, partial [Taenia solium]
LALTNLPFIKGEESPELLGSRVVGYPIGPWTGMKFRYGAQFAAEILRKGSLSSLSIEEGVCKVNGGVWGSPCGLEKDIATISVQDVREQKSLIILKDAQSDEPIAVAHFVRCCNFSRPAKDFIEVRFIQLKGYVKDNNLTSIRNHLLVTAIRCALAKSVLNLNVLDHMVKNTTLDLREFYGTFPITPGADYANFVWGTEKSYLTVSVDFTQSGTSPEEQECETYRDMQKTVPSFAKLCMQGIE